MTVTLRELLANGQRAEAEQLAKQRLSQAPRDAEALAALASLQLERGDIDAARSTLARADEADRSGWEPRWVAALIEVNTSEPAAAEALLRQLWQEQPTRPEVAYALGAFLAGEGRAADGLPALQRAVELAPERWVHHFTLATVLLDVGEPQAAIDALQQVARLNPRHTATYTTLARLLMHMGQREGAQRLLEAALPAVEQPALIEGLMGSLLAGNGALAEGLGWLERALAVLPNHSGFNADKARVLLSLGRTDELVAFCEYLEITGLASTPTRLAQAEALEPSRPAEALALYRRVIQEDAADWLAANAAGLMFLRQSDTQPEVLEEARQLFELALTRSSGRVEPALNLARVFVVAGESATALQLARQVADAVPEGPLHDEAERLIRFLAS